MAVPLPMKLAYGMAGMYWPNVPFAVALNVRLAAKGVSAGMLLRTVLTDGVAFVAVSGRISSLPVALAVLPEPNQVRRTSSSAMVWPGSMVMVVVCAACEI